MKVNTFSILSLILLRCTRIASAHCGNLGSTAVDNAHDACAVNGDVDGTPLITPKENANEASNTISRVPVVGVVGWNEDILGGFFGGCLTTFFVTIGEAIVDAVTGCVRKKKLKLLKDEIKEKELEMKVKEKAKQEKEKAREEAKLVKEKAVEVVKENAVGVSKEKAVEVAKEKAKEGQQKAKEKRKDETKTEDDSTEGGKPKPKKEVKDPAKDVRKVEKERIKPKKIVKTPSEESKPSAEIVSLDLMP